MNLPNMLVADRQDNLIEIPHLKSAGIKFAKPIFIHPQNLLPFENTEHLITLRNRIAIGYDPSLQKCVQLREWDGAPVFPVSADLSMPDISVMRCAYTSVIDAPRLSSHSHTATGVRDGQVVIAACKLSQSFFPGFNILNYTPNVIKESSLCETYGNFAEKKLLFVSIKKCDESFNTHFHKLLLSIQPHVDKIILHVDAIVPSPEIFTGWCKAGLKNVLLSLNSAQSRFFDALHASSRTTFHEVKSLLKLARQFAVNIILDYQIFPGFTDHPKEMNALNGLISEFRVRKLQPNNLGIDPEWYIDELNLLNLSRDQIGMEEWFKTICEFPEIQIGYLKIDA